MRFYKSAVIGMQADSNGFRIDDPIQRCLHKIEDRLRLSIQCAAEKSFGDSDAEFDRFKLSLFEDVIAM